METALAVSQAKYWHLKQVGLFSGLPDSDLRQLVGIADLRLFKHGEEIFRTGDLADRVYVIRTGKVRVYRAMEDNKEATLSYRGPGQMVGESSITGEPLRHDCAEVVEDAFICMIDRERFRGYLLRHPDLALQIAGVIARRRSDAESRITDLLSKDVKTRLAHTLARLAEQYGEEDEDAGGTRIDLRLTQTDLGQLVGSTRETTSMAFNAFRREGLVDAEDRSVIVFDRKALATY